MPYKDPEKRRACCRAYMKRKRAETREKELSVTLTDEELHKKEEHQEKERARSLEKYYKYREKYLERQHRQYWEDLDKSREYGREAARRQRAESPEAQRAAIRRYEEKNRDKRRLKSKTYDDAHREEKRIRRRAWTIANPGKARSHEIRRKLRREQRTPKWADMDELNSFYLNRPEGMHVDHIVPLDGRTVEGYNVSGLHVVSNLQYLSAEDNLRKHNKMRPEDGITAPLPV